jgi:WD40 repeat protein
MVSIRDKRNNLHYLKNGDLVYHAASLGIVHSPSTNKQKFFDQHKDDCISVAVHPNGETVATGELHARPAIYIWDSNTMALLSTTKQGLSKGVDHLAFSPSGSMLMASIMDEYRSILIFVSQVPNKYEMSVIYPGTKDSYFGLIWVNEQNFVSVGPKHYCFWALEEGDDNDTHSQLMGNFEKASDLLTCAAVCPNGDVVCGTSVGELQVWKKNRLVKVLNNPPLHEGALDAVKVSGPR